jgi:hypothetical protein
VPSFYGAYVFSAETQPPESRAIPRVSFSGATSLTSSVSSIRRGFWPFLLCGIPIAEPCHQLVVTFRIFLLFIFFLVALVEPRGILLGRRRLREVEAFGSALDGAGYFSCDWILDAGGVGGGELETIEQGWRGGFRVCGWRVR